MLRLERLATRPSSASPSDNDGAGGTKASPARLDFRRFAITPPDLGGGGSAHLTGRKSLMAIVAQRRCEGTKIDPHSGQRQIAPGLAMPSNRAAILTPSRRSNFASAFHLGDVVEEEDGDLMGAAPSKSRAA